ncbi:MAG: HK97 family phage prohead protease [Mesorhizobium sp.]|uniref:HK97 family phage prohead protease n=1 Tax=Mesorhizobium sp. TaxID=1871066 RepID=UPI000FE2F983|nr:HK97 family phage prohead protease [Mesorhizobium sp.]RWK17052.1 MAG: HK97 family phage prohead protease [Mesorhizobium sp.]RWK27359.1 MAG: HK97 family phage prohead protease [Mesorhizobium sp.]
MAELISGYAVVFNSETNIAGAFREKISPGAFDKSLRDYPDVLALFNHNYDRPLGRTAAGTLELRSDRVGLWFGLKPDETTPDGLTAIGTVRRQDVKGCSFGFTVTRETWDEGGDNELPLRIVEEAVLWEVTLTPLPAYAETSASLSSPDSAANARRRTIEKMEREQKLRGIR